MRAKRTVRKPTRWTPDEWRRIEEAARRRGVPPLRFVREAAVWVAAPRGAAPVRSPRGQVSDELVRQLVRVLNNLNQLHGVAEYEGAHELARVAGDAAHLTEQAIRFAPGNARQAGPILNELVPAGRALNELTHQAHAADSLPSLAETIRVLDAVTAAVHRALE
jgi:hypothetical protein